MILRNVDFPADLIKGLSENEEKIAKYLFSRISELDLSLQNLNSDVKVLKKSEPVDFNTFSTLLKKTEANVERQLSLQKSKISAKIDSLEYEFENFKAQFGKDFENIRQKTEETASDKSWVTSFYELKEEILTKHIKAIEFELKENYKATNMLEQSIKVQNWSSESTNKDFNNRFEVHREKIRKLENAIQDFLNRSDEMISQIVGPVKRTVEECENTVKELYLKFEKETEKALHELSQKDLERQETFLKNSESLRDRIFDLSKVAEDFKETRSLYAQDYQLNIEKVQGYFELYKKEIEKYLAESYQQIRKDLLSSYKEEIKTILDKLKWLPSDNEEIENMTQLEARLFTIETRIRAEESSRISQVSSLFDDLSSFVISGTKKKFKEYRKTICSTARSTTPAKIPVRICKSPGGMRMLHPISSQRIKRCDKNESILKKIL